MSDKSAASLASAAPRLQRWAVGPATTIAITLLVLAGMVFTLNAYYLHVGILAALAVVIGISVRPLLLAGEASFCHGTFYALGAYTVGILSSTYGVNFWVALPLAGLVAAFAALVIGIPSLRTTGSYFFLTTFCFLVVTNSLFQHLRITGGHGGIKNIPKPYLVASIGDFFILVTAFAVLSVLAFYRLDRSRWGLELRALGDSNPLAQAAGASRLGNMLGAFSVGAFFAGIAGGIYASYVSFIAPSSFSMWLSVYALMYVVVGGPKYLMGAIVGAIVLTAVPIAVSWSDIYEAIFAAAITLVIILALPSGVVTGLRDVLIGRRTPLATINLSDTGLAAEEAAPLPRSQAQARAPLAAPETEVILSVENVSKQFGGVRAVDGVSLQVFRGETLGVIGPNGAGKTTLFNIISGFEKPTGGNVLFEGLPILHLAPHKVVERGLTRTFQSASVFGRLSVMENVLVACRGDVDRIRRAVAPLSSDREAIARANGLIALFDLATWRYAEAQSMPYGARRRLGLAIAMATNPRLLCLDEPMAGLSDAEAEQMVAVIASIRARSEVTIVLIEHRMLVVRELCTRLIALDFGRVVTSGSVDEVTSHPDVITSYLASSARKANDG